VGVYTAINKGHRVIACGRHNSVIVGASTDHTHGIQPGRTGSSTSMGVSNQLFHVADLRYKLSSQVEILDEESMRVINLGKFYGTPGHSTGKWMVE